MNKQNLADAALSASQVATSLQISSRYLSMLMRDDDSTFGRYILTQRLAKAALTLHSPLHAEASISQLAWSVGFSDMAYFSRAFRAQFDCSPTEYRHQNTTD